MEYVKLAQSVFDGRETHPPGKIVRLDLGLARRIVLRGHGELVEHGGAPVPVAQVSRRLGLESYVELLRAGRGTGAAKLLAQAEVLLKAAADA